MGVESKADEETKRKIVEQHFKHGMTVKHIAKVHKLAVPTIYNYIRAAKEENAAKAISVANRNIGMSDNDLELTVRVKKLEQENASLKHRLMHLMTKHGEW